jgi:SNF2 family DNA or RNA helicase
MKTKPLWAHQKKSIAFGNKQPRMLDLSDPGTAKTRVQLELFAARRRKRGGCALMVVPKSLIKTAWGNDAAEFVPDMKVSLCYADKREKYFAEDADIYVTNTDAVVWLVKQKPAFFKRFDTLVIDEITSFKHHTSGRSRAINKIKKYFDYRSGLSGTPNSNTICDVWHPALIIDDGKRLGQSFYAFRSTVCVPEQVGPTAQMVKWVDKDGAEEAVFDLLSDLTIRHKFEDCIDIPPTHKATMMYDLPAKQMKAYREMEATQMMMLQKQGEIKAVTAINAAAVTTKLLQIASGAVYESPDNYHIVDTGRYEMIMDLVEERKHPIVAFLWKHQRDELVKEATKRKLKFCVIDGNATDTQRSDMVKAYQAGFYDVMFAHPKTAAHGLTLTKGTSIIWPSPTYDLEWFSQMNKRQARAGQTEKTEIIVVLAPGTIEIKVYEKLLVKNARMGNLLDLFAEAA